MRINAEAGGAVMATGIVSVAIHYEGLETLSRVLLVVCALMWLVLAVLLLLVLLFNLGHALQEAKRPAALTAVAGTAVLGVRVTLLGWSWAGWALLVMAAALAALLLVVIARAGPLPKTGGSFLVVVAVQALAVLAATLGIADGHTWPAFVALVLGAVGLAAYPLVLARFDVRELRLGTGDHWVSGGALAISTLAFAQITYALGTSKGPAGLHGALRIATVVVWGVTVVWLPALVVAEIRWPRPSYDILRWATVFPLGMYAVMSTSTGRAATADGLVQFGHVAAWVALAAWTATALGWTRRQLPLARRGLRRGLRPRRQRLSGAARGPTPRCRT